MDCFFPGDKAVLLTDLNELKKILEIDPRNTAEDAKFNFFIEQASAWILEYLNRPNIGKQSRTEYYNGTNTVKLNLKSRPIFTTPTIECFVDGAGSYGQVSGAFTAQGAQLTYGTDFFLKIDQPDGTSRCGILIRRGDVWARPIVRDYGLLSPFIGEAYGNIKIVYTGGYTVDTLPAQLRAACNLLVTRMRYVFPLGMEIGSESYEERHISLVLRQKDYLMAMVKPLLVTLRNWSF